MIEAMQFNSEIFLQKYRILEGILEKRYEGKRISSSSVVIEYIREDDSEPVRVDLDLLREIRNILSHNAGSNGQAVVEPSDEMIARLDAITEYVRRPHRACDFGTPSSQIFSATPNDKIYAVMRTMHKNGFSHVPVQDCGRVIGVFSIRCVFDYLSRNGINSLDEDARIRILGSDIRLERETGERYMFVPEDTSIITVRRAFQRYTQRNRRLSAVFVTPNGTPNEGLICMLTPWNVLSDRPLVKETDHASAKPKP